MTSKTGYGQYCPIAVAAEVLCTRWTPLVIRALCMGATRYSEIRESVPLMSTALLSRRLRELEDAGILLRRRNADGRGHEYRLTEAGEALLPVLEAMGFWSQRWLRRAITRAENLDPDVFMWELRRSARNADRPAQRRRVVEFRLRGVPPEKQRYWLVFEPAGIDICTRDPGHPVDLWVAAHIRTLVEVWLGHRGLAAALGGGDLRIDGDEPQRRAFEEWFALSAFARPDPGGIRRGA